MPIFMMKDINITYDEYLTTDDFIFEEMIENYNMYHDTNIYKLWYSSFFFRFRGRRTRDR